MARNIICIKIKNLLEKIRIIRRWEDNAIAQRLMYNRVGENLWNKRQEVLDLFLDSQKRKDKTKEDYYKGQLELLEWIINEKVY